MSLPARVMLDKVIISEFRSWRAGSFTFAPGVTLVTGRNGAGKSTIGLAVQHAVSGRVPRLGKDDLRRRDAADNAKMRVSLHLTVGDQPVALVRTGSKAVLRVGEETTSVREAEYLADLKQSIEYSFLAQNVAAFVDLPEFKRREILDDLIPEVRLLRAVCHPELKNILKRYNGKRQSVATNIVQVQAMAQEYDAQLYAAKKAYDDALARQKAILAAQEERLPFTAERYAELEKNRAELQARIAEVTDYGDKARKWLEYAQAEMNNQAAVRRNMTSRAESLQKTRGYRDHLASLVTAMDDVFCQNCKQPLTCAHCGTVAVSPGNTADSRRELEKLDAQIATLMQQDEKDAAYLAAAAPIDPQVFQQTTESYNAAKNDLAAMQPMLATVVDNMHAYEVAMSNIRAAQEASDSSASIAAFKKQYTDLKARKSQLEEIVKRKERLHGIMLSLENDLRTAADITHSTLPLIYFDDFLQNLSRACNFLLAAISSLVIDMHTTEDGIAITVSGKKLAQLSSGEMQRVRVAVTLAFSLMAVKTDTLFLDELFDSALDSEGVAALAVLLHGTITKFYPKIVVITHNEALMTALQPTQIVTVVKTPEGVSECHYTSCAASPPA